ncbi:MAG: hypothetical protein QM478_13535 [Flavobacteriaceae bacterium]
MTLKWFYLLMQKTNVLKELNLNMCIDIEIRAVTENNNYFKVVIYQFEKTDTGETVRTVRDVYHADDYQTAVTLLPNFL